MNIMDTNILHKHYDKSDMYRGNVVHIHAFSALLMWTLGPALCCFSPMNIESKWLKQVHKYAGYAYFLNMFFFMLPTGFLMYWKHHAMYYRSIPFAVNFGLFAELLFHGIYSLPNQRKLQ